MGMGGGKQGVLGKVTPQQCLKGEACTKWKRFGSTRDKVDEMKKGQEVKKWVICTVLQKNEGGSKTRPSSPCYPTSVYLLGDAQYLRCLLSE